MSPSLYKSFKNSKSKEASFPDPKFDENRPLADNFNDQRTTNLKEVLLMRDSSEKEIWKEPQSPNGRLFSDYKKALGYWKKSRQRPRNLNIDQPRPPPLLSYVLEEHTEDVTYAIEANVIYYKNKMPYDHQRFEGTLPNQKIPLKNLLHDDERNNPFMWECENDMIRYFHVPVNNMAWIELRYQYISCRHVDINAEQEFIARYYNEVKPELSVPNPKPIRREPPSKTRMLLRPEYWRGLQYPYFNDSPCPQLLSRVRSKG